MIRFEHVTKQYGDNVILNDLNFEIEEGKFVILIGPSGCGKTTTLKMINRLIDPNSGHIYIDDKDINSIDKTALRRSIGYRSLPQYDRGTEHQRCAPPAEVSQGKM